MLFLAMPAAGRTAPLAANLVLAALLIVPATTELALYAREGGPMTRRLMRWASRSRPAVAVQAA